MTRSAFPIFFFIRLNLELFNKQDEASDCANADDANRNQLERLTFHKPKLIELIIDKTDVHQSC